MAVGEVFAGDDGRGCERWSWVGLVRRRLGSVGDWADAFGGGGGYGGRGGLDGGGGATRRLLAGGSMSSACSVMVSAAARQWASVLVDHRWVRATAI
ncbi:hypothetical protein Dimus_022765, partial [Dionaea muscipula]